MRLEVHNVAPAQPRQVAVVLFVLVVLDLQQGLFSFFEFLRGGRGQTEVPVEVVVIDEVRSDRFEINQYIIELFQNEEALSHALSAGNGVAFRGRGSNHLEEVLGNSEVIFLLGVLANYCMHHCLQDVLLGDYALHILY